VLANIESKHCCAVQKQSRTKAIMDAAEARADLCIDAGSALHNPKLVFAEELSCHLRLLLCAVIYVWPCC